MLLQKLDEDTRRLWAESNEGSEDHPTIAQFISFLNNRWNALECMQSYKTCTPRTASSRTHCFVATAQKSKTSNSWCTNCGDEHPLLKCIKFKNLTTQEKRDRVKALNLCFNCLSTSHWANSCTSSHKCHYCGQAHHSCLHIEYPTTSTPRNIPADQLPNQAANSQNSHNSLSTLSFHTNNVSQMNHQVLLPTAVVKASDITSAHSSTCKILMDSASMGTFVSEELVKRLCLPRKYGRIKVGGIGGTGFVFTRGIVSIRLTSRFDPSSSVVIEAYILNRISHKTQCDSTKVSQCTFLKNLCMADDGSLRSWSIDVLIGSQHFFNFLAPGTYTNHTGFPTAQNTIFGYVLAGKVHNGGEEIETFTTTISPADSILNTSIRQFWEWEQIPDTPQSCYTPEEQYCESHFAQNHNTSESGRHIVRLPFRETNQRLGESLKTAYKQFLSLERRFVRDPSLYAQYKEFMKEYESLGHMEKIPPESILSSSEKCFYLPHHPVLKPGSKTTKCRVVFNGSAKSSTGVSLNDLLTVGPTLQRDLTSLLLEFRKYRIALCGDIEKMYRQVLLHPQDRDFQRILWREYITQPVSHYKLCTVTYGTASAPYLATKCLQVTGNEAKSPNIKQLIQNNFYVDDFIAGADTVQEACSIKTQVTNTLKENGFTLTKWSSNSSKVIMNKNPPVEFAQGLDVENIKILGLLWHQNTDCFSFHVSPAEFQNTKRSILSESAKIYDPLGFLSPCTVVIKIMFQQLWLHPFGWDDELPDSVSTQWLTFRQEYTAFNSLQIPRWIHNHSGVKMQLCGFSDASESAYAAAVYCRVVSETTIHVSLLAAKTKVAPLQQISLPRLELSGALLLAKLVKAVKLSMKFDQVEVYAWTDSTIVLGWLSSHPRRWKTYVANRVSQISDVIARSSWRHIMSTDNPADIATRGLAPKQLLNCKLWWNGPQWLSHPESLWPAKTVQLTIDDNVLTSEERKNHCFAFVTTEQPDVLTLLCERISNINKIFSIIASWNRLIYKRRQPATEFPNTYTAAELQSALLHCVRWSQGQHYANEIRQLINNKTIAMRNSLAKLLPYMDNVGVMRVGGRLKHAKFSCNIKHPIILAKESILAYRIVQSQHLVNLHAGPTLLMNILRQRFWIIGCRLLVKQIIHQCVTCTRYRATINAQQMADLPPSRVTPTRAFLRTGIDYAGPFLAKPNKGRTFKTTKVYIALFVCLSTRAIHLEAVSDLSTDAFLAAFKRFIARRGLPSDVHSDNGTNFVGASRELVKAFKFVSKDKEIGKFLAQQQINWHLIPPGAPHFGGIWEAAVKSTKFHLRRVIGESRLTFEEFTTVLCGIEAQLNSRPLAAIYDDDIDNIDVLTPGHFLIGHSLVQLPEPNLDHIQMNRLSRWQLLTRIQQDFWRRWQKEYITTLQQRSKWRTERKNITPGDVVLIYEERTPPSLWRMGLVTEVHPGSDNLVRVASVKTNSGTTKRPVTKLVKLPMDC